MKRCSHSEEMNLLLPSSNHSNMKNFISIIPNFFYNSRTNTLIKKSLNALTRAFPHNVLDKKFELNSQFRSFYEIELDEDNDPAYNIFIRSLFDNFLFYKSRYAWYLQEGGIRETTNGALRRPDTTEKESFEKIKLVDKYDMTDYETFIHGRVQVGKEERKLFRFCKQNNLLSDVQIDRLNTAKTKGGLYLCISRNPVDYLFASTNQSYGSCISLDSEAEGCFYMGLGGLAIDPNRFLMFITNGKLKRYTIHSREFKHFKYMSRSWGIMAKHDKIHIVGSYPADKIGLDKQLKKLGWAVDGFHSENNCKESLLSFEIARHEDGSASSIYIDSPGLAYHQKNKKDHARNWYHSHEGATGSLCEFSFNGSFNEVNDFSLLTQEAYYCDRCGDRCYEDNSYYYDGFGTICEYCYNTHFITCYSCGEVDESSRGVEHQDNIYCHWCADDFIHYCEKCGITIHTDNDDFEEGDHGYYCSQCADKLMFTCDGCSNRYFKDECFEGLDGCNYCEECYNEQYDYCNECKIEMEIEDLTKIGWELFCQKCAEERSADETINDAV